LDEEREKLEALETTARAAAREAAVQMADMRERNQQVSRARGR
jgi:hypothetical protein